MFLFACAINIINDNLCGIVLGQVVHRDDELVVARVVARGVLVFLDVSLAGGIHLRYDVAGLLQSDFSANLRPTVRPPDPTSRLMVMTNFSFLFIVLLF